MFVRLRITGISLQEQIVQAIQFPIRVQRQHRGVRMHSKRASLYARTNLKLIPPTVQPCVSHTDYNNKI